MGTCFSLGFHIGRFKSSQCLVLSSANSNLYSKFKVCNWVKNILVRWVVIMIGYPNYGDIMVASFFKPEIGICISVSKLVLLLKFHEVGCCMACVNIMALTVLHGDMLAVSAQCGCCHHFNICFNTYAL